MTDVDAAASVPAGFIVQCAADNGASLFRSSLLLGGEEWRALVAAGLPELLRQPTKRAQLGPELGVAIFNARTPAMAREALARLLRDLSAEERADWMRQPYMPGRAPLWVDCAERAAPGETGMGSAQRARADACWPAVLEAAGPARWVERFEVKTGVGRSKRLGALEYAFWRNPEGPWGFADLLLRAGAPLTGAALYWAVRAQPAVIPTIAAHLERHPADRALVRRALLHGDGRDADTVTGLRALLARSVAADSLHDTALRAADRKKLG